MSKFKAGHVCIIGKPNVGKSTLLNRLVSQKISIVSRKPQTTRCRINGIKNSKSSQIIFVDTPGFQINPKITLNRHMNKEVSNSLVFVDIVVFVIEALNWNELDYNVVKLLKNIDKTKLFLAVNKIDKIPDKEELLSEIDFISIGDKVIFTENNKSYNGKIIRKGKFVNSKTQNISVFATINSEKYSVLAIQCYL